MFYLCSIELRPAGQVNRVQAPELLFTVTQLGKAVSIVRAKDASAAIEIAHHMLEVVRPVEAPLQARFATALESRKFFDDACAWIGGVRLAGIILDGAFLLTMH
jgi:hypothetical protein